MGFLFKQSNTNGRHPYGVEKEKKKPSSKA